MADAYKIKVAFQADFDVVQEMAALIGENLATQNDILSAIEAPLADGEGVGESLASARERLNQNAENIERIATLLQEFSSQAAKI